MHFSKFICLTAALAVTVSSSKSRLETKASRPQLRLLVAGASIAHGKMSGDENGFRLQLEATLVAAGNDVQMLGSVKSGKMKHNALEAIPGARIDEVMARLVSTLPHISPPPNIVLVQAGANDLSQKATPDTMQKRITALVDHVCTAIPGVNVVLSTLLPSQNTEPGVLAYNAKLREVVEAQKKQGRHVYLADVHSAEFSMADVLPPPDGTHPTAQGYAKMARVYADVILGIVKERFAPPPPPVPSTSSAAPKVMSTSASKPESTTTTCTTSAPTSTETKVKSTLSTQVWKQVASRTIAPSATATAQIAKQLPSNSTAMYPATNTSNPAVATIINHSASAKHGANSCYGHPLIMAVVMLALAVPLFAV